ncbi:MAG: DUF4367 domain-containing protein [Eubacterium sp.]|nr:DUF4367 domain-containing protein [Eubacterium sp.]
MKISDEMLYENAGKARDIWLGSLPKGRDIPEHRFSHGFERRMNALIRKQRRSPFINNMVQVFKWSAAAILIMFVLTTSFAITVDAFREKVIEIVTKVFSNRTEYYFSTEETELYIPEIEFGYLPEGMELVKNETYDTMMWIEYNDKEGNSVSLIVSGVTSNGSKVMGLDTEESDYEEIFIDGKEMIINSKNGETDLIWTEDNVVYDLWGNISEEELLDIEKNLKKILY